MAAVQKVGLLQRGECDNLTMTEIEKVIDCDLITTQVTGNRIVYRIVRDHVNY